MADEAATTENTSTNQSHDGDAGADSTNKEVAQLKEELAKRDLTINDRDSANQALQGQLGELRDMLTNPEVLSRMAQGYNTPANEMEQFKDGIEDPIAFANRLEKTVLDKAANASNSQMQQITHQLATVRMELQIGDARRKFPDFDQQMTQMKKLSAQHPSLGAEHLYTLAKGESGRAAEAELAKQKETTLSRGANQPSSTATSPLAEALKGKEGIEITKAVFESLKRGE